MWTDEKKSCVSRRIEQQELKSVREIRNGIDDDGLPGSRLQTQGSGPATWRGSQADGVHSRHGAQMFMIVSTVHCAARGLLRQDTQERGRCFSRAMFSRICVWRVTVTSAHIYENNATCLTVAGVHAARAHVHLLRKRTKCWAVAVEAVVCDADS